MRVHVHDHGGGCHGDVCNASATIPGVSISLAVLREPCERFTSLLHELEREPNVARDMGLRAVPSNSSALGAYVAHMTAGCAGDDVACVVQAIDRRVLGPARIFLYPQALFVASEHAAQSIVCYDSLQLGERLDAFMVQRAGCTMDTSQQSWRERLAMDVSTKRDAHRDATGLKRDEDSVKRDDQLDAAGHHPHGGGSAPLSDFPLSVARSAPVFAKLRRKNVRSVRGVIGTPAAHALCRQVRALYQRDADLWAEHCARGRA